AVGRVRREVRADDGRRRDPDVTIGRIVHPRSVWGQRFLELGVGLGVVAVVVAGGHGVVVRDLGVQRIAVDVAGGQRGVVTVGAAGLLPGGRAEIPGGRGVERRRR